MDLPWIGSKLGDYEIVRLIGRGGMGAVYEAHNPQIKRRVAIKLLLPEFTQREDVVRRFHNEAVAVNAISHPGVVQVSEVGKAPDGSLYLVMEYLEGETLSERLLHSAGKLTEAEVVTISWQLAGVLTAAHAKSITHRDLKPGNVMLVPDMAGPDGERVKLLDFGIAKLGGQQDTSLQALTRTGQIFGTASYMSPEQFRQGKLLDGQSDVYSLGVVMYRMVAGRLPFVSEHGEMGLAALHMFEKVPPLKELSPAASTWLAELIETMLRKDAKERPVMAEVAEQLQAHLPFRAPSRNSFPPGQRSRSTPAPPTEKELAETAPDLSPPFPIPSRKSEPSRSFKSSTIAPSTAGSGLEFDDGQPHSLTAANGQMTRSSLGRLVRRPLFIAISFGLLGAGLGSLLVSRAANPEAKASLKTSAALPQDSPDKIQPLAPASAVSAPNIAAAGPAGGGSLVAAPSSSGQSASVGNSAGTPTGQSADNLFEPRSHKPARRVRSSKRTDGNKDGTPAPNAAGTHPTLLND